MPVAAAFVLDAVLTIAFAVFGRASHDEALDFGGIAETAWPFLVGLICGWVLVRATANQWPVTLRTGWSVWLFTVVFGMALRWAIGAGTAAAFVVVATVTLGVLLLGWRFVAGLLRRDPRPADTP